MVIQPEKEAQCELELCLSRQNKDAVGQLLYGDIWKLFKH